MRKERGWRPSSAAWLGWVLLLCGCTLPATPSATTVPDAWRECRPFGPRANAARNRGELRPLYVPPQAEIWETFARAHIQDGDVLFRLGRSRTVRGYLTSYVLADVCDSRFCHDGLAQWEGDTLWVYDAESQGVRKIPFVFWMMDVCDGRFAVMRLRSEYCDAIPAALAYCEEAYRKETPYNFWLKSEEEEGFYCAQLVEMAYRAGGLALSEPVAIRRLPHYRRYVLVGLAADLLTPLSTEQRVFSPGNRYYGTYGSPFLELIYEGDGPDDEGQFERLPPLDDADEAEEE
jgi:hypothetical protein